MKSRGEYMDNDVAKVIDRTDLIENIINQIITKYISPRKEIIPFFWDIFLNSSIISLGAKLKLVVLLAREIGFEIKEDPIRRVINLRNAFAHHGLYSHPALIVEKTPDEDKSDYQLQIITSSLKLKRMSRESALKEFNEVYKSAKNILLDLKKEMDAHLS